MSSKREPSKPARLARYPLRIVKHIINLPKFDTNLEHETRRLHDAASTMSKTLEAVRIETLHLHNKATAGETAQQDILHRIQQLDYRLNDLAHQLTIMNEERRDSGNAKKTQAAPASDLVADEHLLDNFYVEFERWFRGTDEEIKERQKVYLPYFTESKIDSTKYPVIDIGCGRGEFVQLLKENDVRAIGLDLNKAMVEHARKKGLEAEAGDALAYLRKQKTNSLMAITGFHIVEHIPFLDLVRIFDECYRTLQPAGFVIFETPNPENVIVGTCNFYSDPSHLHPLPPAFLDFTMKTRGFNKTEVKRLHPIKSNISDKDPLVQEMAERMYGPQDYAVIAYK
jgi:2-polyprenyl-3-methyl-5-hydroxy-6-metoxy-1,4-benzoquinol methylase